MGSLIIRDSSTTFQEKNSKRMKDMVSTCRTFRVRPKWIGNTLWTEMKSEWDTEEARQRSKIASAARKSDHKGLGEHVHFIGKKSYAQVQQEMEQELGRPVSVGEVFMNIHTRPDGSFVDLKEKRIAETYEKNLQAKLSELESDTYDGTSRP